MPKEIIMTLAVTIFGWCAGFIALWQANKKERQKRNDEVDEKLNLLHEKMALIEQKEDQENDD